MTKELTTRPHETSTEELVRDLLAEVKEEIASHPIEGQGKNNLAARVYHKAIQISEERRQHYSRQIRAVQAQIVVEVCREQAWLSMLTDDNDFRGYADLDEFLRSTGVNNQTRYTLSAIGNILLPYFDKHEVPITSYLTEQVYTNFVEAVPAIRARIEEIEVQDGKQTDWVLKNEIGDRKRTGERRVAKTGENLDEVQQILEDCKKAENRRMIRKKWQEHRSDPLGDAGWVHIGQKRVLVIVADEDAVKQLNARINGKVRWGLVATGGKQGSAIRLVINE